MIKKCTILGILLVMLVASMMNSTLASQDNGASGVAIAGDIVPYEVPMEINCTWSHGNVPAYVPPAILGWSSDSNTIPGLPDSGWSNQILSIHVIYPMYVNISITDSFTKGDYFEVWEVDGVSPTSGQLIGTTPIVPVAAQTTGLPDPAFSDPTYSHDTFTVLLNAGTHYFAFREVGHNYNGGAYYVKFCPGPLDIPPPVGGNLLPTNGLVGTSLIALVSIFSAVLIASAVKKRRF